MSADQDRGLVVAKPPTGPRPAKVCRTAIAKPRPIPKKELYNRLVRTKDPPHKTVRAPTERKNLHPHGLAKGLTGSREQKRGQQDTYVGPKWNDIYNPYHPNSYQDYKSSDEQRKGKLEWKARLHAHQTAEGRDGRQSDRRGQDSAELGNRRGR